VTTCAYASTNNQLARPVCPLVSSSKTKPHQFSSVQLRRCVCALTATQSCRQMPRNLLANRYRSVAVVMMMMMMMMMYLQLSSSVLLAAAAAAADLAGFEIGVSMTWMSFIAPWMTTRRLRQNLSVSGSTTSRFTSPGTARIRSITYVHQLPTTALNSCRLYPPKTSFMDNTLLSPLIRIILGRIARLVCPSVCPSVAYELLNKKIKTKKLRKTDFVLTFDS